MHPQPTQSRYRAYIPVNHAKPPCRYVSQTSWTTGGDNLDYLKLFASAFVVCCRRIRRIRRRASAHYMTHAKTLSRFSDNLNNRG